MSTEKYKFGDLTAEYLSVLPEVPMSVGEILCGTSKPAKRCRQLSLAYGSISAQAFIEACNIKYPKP